MENKKPSGLPKTTSECISSHSSAYFSQKKSPAARANNASDFSPSDTEEGRRQRRFDSITRVLGLNSKKSACAAFTILDDEIIIASNCAEGEDPASIAQLLKQKLLVLRTILKEYVDREDFSLNQADATQYFAKDILTLQTHGGFFQPLSVVTQALYKLARSVSSNDNLDIDEHAFTPEEIQVLLFSNNITILVPGEDMNDAYLQSSEDMDLSDITTISSPLTQKSSSTQSMKHRSSQSLFSSDEFCFSNGVSPLPSKKSLDDLDDSLDNIGKSESGFSEATFQVAASKAPKETRFFKHWKTLEENDTDYSSDEANVKAVSNTTYVAHTDDYLLSSLDESFSQQLDLSFNSSTHDYIQHFVMNIYQQDQTIPLSFPDSIYHNKNKPSTVAGFHAEQLIAYYLKEVKKINLYDTSAPAIPFGISKLCCIACTILYQFPRIKIRGTSFNNFDGVPNLFTEIDFQTPNRPSSHNNRVAKTSPWT